MSARKLIRSSAQFLGWSYASTTGDNRFPVIREPLPSGLLLKAGDDPRIDCSTFIAALVVYAFPDVEFDDQYYADAQIFDAARPWSPVEAWARHGIGTRTDGPVDGWAIYQSWRSLDPLRSGHQWAYHGGLKLRLHSSSSRGGIGPTMDRGVTWDSLSEYYRAGIRGVEL